MSSKWWLHWKRRQEIIGIPEFARFFQQVFIFCYSLFWGCLFSNFFNNHFWMAFWDFFHNDTFRKTLLCQVNWKIIHKALKTNCWTSEFEKKYFFKLKRIFRTTQVCRLGESCGKGSKKEPILSKKSQWKNCSKKRTCRRNVVQIVNFHLV